MVTDVTEARVAVEAVRACATILARVTGTLVNVTFTVHSLPSGGTLAYIVVVTRRIRRHINARASVLAPINRRVTSHGICKK